MESHLVSGAAALEQSTPYLPAEIKSNVARCLIKSNLKTLRCVSKQWHAVSTPFLFDRLYVSPRDKDLRVFTNLTSHPIMSSAVKEIIYDVSYVPDLSHEEYFLALCNEVRKVTIWLTDSFNFTDPNPRLNQFVNAVIESGYSFERLFSEYGNDRLVTEGFQLWQTLVAEERRNFDDELQGGLFSTLCSGIQRLTNLQTVKMDGDMWSMNREHITSSISPLTLYLETSTVPSGSPLARSWNVWHPRPRRPGYGSGDEAPENLSLMMRALSGAETSIKHFSYWSSLRNGLSPMVFGRYDITASFAFQMCTALSRLESLQLQITPQDVDQGESNPLGFLPHLLEQMNGLKGLMLNLITAQRVEKRRVLSTTPVEDTLYTYSQVFSQRGRWPKLERLHLSGLAIAGLDFWFFLNHQVPQLQRLLLNNIDLLEANWEGAVEAMRYRGAWLPWKMISLQQKFRHKGNEWWPCTPKREEKEWLALQKYSSYIEYGGRHPSLPKDREDSHSVSYLNEMYYAASRERLETFHSASSMY